MNKDYRIRAGKDERGNRVCKDWTSPEIGSKISKHFHMGTEQWSLPGAILLPKAHLACLEMFLIVMIEGWRGSMLLASRSC